jgi:trk system potassium uptake protein TrkH
VHLPQKLNTPARISICAFVGLILVGTTLLMLPEASAQRPLSFVDALFTATSACCVTGLIVVDTSKDLTMCGQLVVLGLIQAGGLGILTLSTVFLLLAGRRLSLAGRFVVQDTFTQSGDRRLSSLVLDVVRFTLVIEGIGVVLLFFAFMQGRAAGEALYLSIFHSISAFCNAGFSLFSDSMMSFRSDWLANLTLSFLIIFGGIGFLVLAEIKSNFSFSRSTWSRISLHSKLALSSACLLILLGTLLLLMMEQRNTLASIPLSEKVLGALFQSVTARTAGFNSIPIDQLANESLFLIILFMFIGGSSGSCAGGIKTGTLATLVILGLSRLLGHDSPQIFRRSISPVSVARAASVVMVSIFVVVVATLALQLTELGGAAHPVIRGKFLELFFEAVSAFGTVGLSTGVTSQLSLPGKLVIIVVMFVGRLGPLAVAVAVTRRKVMHYRYAEELIMIG